MRVFSLTITAGVLQLVNDDRDDGEVATRVGDGNGERDEVETEPVVCVWAMCLGHCLSARSLSPPFVRPIHFWPPKHCVPSSLATAYAKRAILEIKNISLYFQRHGREISVSPLFHHVVATRSPRYVPVAHGMIEGPIRASLFWHAISTFSITLSLARVFGDGATHGLLGLWEGFCNGRRLPACWDV